MAIQRIEERLLSNGTSMFLAYDDEGDFVFSSKFYAKDELDEMKETASSVAAELWDGPGVDVMVERHEGGMNRYLRPDGR